MYNKVMIKHRAVSEENEFMPLFLYSEPLNIVEEDDHYITVSYHNCLHYTYKYKRKYIEKYIKD